MATLKRKWMRVLKRKITIMPNGTRLIRDEKYKPKIDEVET